MILFQTNFTLTFLQSKKGEDLVIKQHGEGQEEGQEEEQEEQEEQEETAGEDLDSGNISLAISSCFRTFARLGSIPIALEVLCYFFFPFYLFSHLPFSPY